MALEPELPSLIYNSYQRANSSYPRNLTCHKGPHNEYLNSKTSKSHNSVITKLTNLQNLSLPIPSITFTFYKNLLKSLLHAIPSAIIS